MTGTGGVTSSTPPGSGGAYATTAPTGTGGTGGSSTLGSLVEGVAGAPPGTQEVPESADLSVMGDGTSNATRLGGYWFTFVDRSGRSNIVPNTGKVDPKDTWSIPAKLRPSLAPGNGIEDGAYHVYGFVGSEPHYLTTDEADLDRYWDAFYGRVGTVARGMCETDGCGEIAYPEAGIGFGFLPHNAPLGAAANDKVGIAFKLKLGASHAIDPDNAKPFPIDVTLPMDLTDVPDPTMADHFGTEYAGLGSPNKPLCTFAGTLNVPEPGLTPGSQEKTCFRHMTTQDKVVLDVTTEWQTFCLSWQAFDVPRFPPDDMPVTSVADAKAHLTKVRFEAFKPKYDAYASDGAKDFDFYVDDVLLLDQAKWDSVCANAIIPQPDPTL